MKGVILREPGSLVVVDDLPEPPAPAPGEALLAVRRVGVCGTDLHAFHGRQPDRAGVGWDTFVPIDLRHLG